MLIKCPKCNHENQLGSIFCRNCGDKLEIDRMEPKVKDKSGPSLFKTIRKIVVLVLFLAVVGIGCAMFVPAGLKQYEALPEDQVEVVDKQFEAFVNKAENNVGRQRQFVFTPQQLSYLFNSKFMGEAEGEGAQFGVKAVNFDIDDAGNVVVAMDTKLGGKVPVRFSVAGKPYVDTAEEESVVTFSVKGAKIGHMPAIAFLQGIATGKFSPLVDERVLKLFSKLESIDVDDEGNVALTLKKVRRKRRRRRK